MHKGKRKDCLLLARALPCAHETVIITYAEGKEKKMTVSYNALPVKLPDKERPLFLVVVKGFGKADDAPHQLSREPHGQREHMEDRGNLPNALEV